MCRAVCEQCALFSLICLLSSVRFKRTDDSSNLLPLYHLVILTPLTVSVRVRLGRAVTRLVVGSMGAGTGWT